MRTSLPTCGRIAGCGLGAAAVLWCGVGCWHPRSNGVASGRWAAPGWERGPLAAAEASAGAALQASWDAEERFPLSIVGVSTDPDGQRAVSDIVTEETVLSELLVPRAQDATPDAGSALPGLEPQALTPDRCLQLLDAGLSEGPCRFGEPRGARRGPRGDGG